MKNGGEREAARMYMPDSLHCSLTHTCAYCMELDKASYQNQDLRSY